MGSKTNLNINNEWEPEVRPILDEWKKEYGDFSGKVCESIVFMKQATTEHIYEAIMAYDSRRADTIENSPTKPLTHWEKTVINILSLGKDPMFTLTKAPNGPQLSPMQARVAIERLKKIDTKEAKETEFDRLMYRYGGTHKARFGTGNFMVASPEELDKIISHLETNLRVAKQVKEAHLQSTGNGVAKPSQASQPRTEPAQEARITTQ